MGYVHRPEEAAIELVAVLEHIAATAARRAATRSAGSQGGSTISAVASMLSLSNDEPVLLQGNVPLVSLLPSVTDPPIEEACSVDASIVLPTDATFEWEEVSMSTADQDWCAVESDVADSTNSSPPNPNLSLTLYQPPGQFTAVSTTSRSLADGTAPTESISEMFDIDSFHSSEDGASDIRTFLGFSDLPHSSSYEEIAETMYGEMEPAPDERWFFNAEDTETGDRAAEVSALGTSVFISSTAADKEYLQETLEIDSSVHASSALAPDLVE